MNTSTSPCVKIVSTEELEHEEQEVDGKADEHGLVLDVLLRVQPRLRSPPPAPVSRLSAQRSSNMRRRRWTARLISIALYWMYSSVFSRD